MTLWSYFRGSDIFDIKVGYRCNNACVHCIVDPVRRRIDQEGLKAELSTADIETLLQQAVASGAGVVVLTGGEVTIRPDFERLVRAAAERQLRVVIQTNGRKLAREDLCARLASIPAVSFMVALHGATAEIHDAITRRTGSFRETCAAIRNLRAIDKDVIAKLVLIRSNLGGVRATVDLARSLGAQRFCVVFPHAAEFPPERFHRVVARYSELDPDIRAVCSYADEKRFAVSFENFPYCVVAGSPGAWQRSCDLRAATAERRPLPAEACRSFDWEDVRRTMKAKPPACRWCVFDRICEGPWREYVEAYGIDEFVPLSAETVSDLVSTDGANVAR